MTCWKSLLDTEVEMLMPWEPWLRTDQRTLARYANPEAVKLIPKLSANPTDLRGDPDGKLKTLCLIYEALVGCGIHYDRAPVSFTPGEQILRQPIDIVRPPQQGTCLDLALLMSGLCIHYDLLPLLVLIKGHALVAVSRKQYLRDTLHQPPDELQSFIRGLLQADRGSVLRTLVHNKAYIALECTGFAATHALATTLPEGRGRDTNGCLSFDRAVEAGQEQLDLTERPFLYALDVVSLHRQQSPYVISLPYELAEVERSSVPAPRSSQAAPVGGRAATIQRQSLQKRLEALEQEYQAVDSQFNSTIDAGMRVRLQARLDDLSQEIQQADEALHRLARLPKVSTVTPTAQSSAPLTAHDSHMQRCTDLAKNIDETLELIRQYEEQRRLTDDPRTKLRAEYNIKDLRGQLEAHEQERQELGCEGAVTAPIVRLSTKQQSGSLEQTPVIQPQGNSIAQRGMPVQTPQKADVLLVTVTAVETKAVLDEFRTQLQREPERQFVDANTYFYLGSMREAQVYLVSSEMGAGGVGGSMLTVSDSIQALNPSAIIMVGIAFGVDPTKQQIGEILVAKQLLDYELQRVGSDANGKAVIRMRGDRPSASPSLLSRFRSGVFDWQGANVDFGLVLSGAKLVDQQDFREQLRAAEPEAIGGEMEGAGLYGVAQRKKVDWILVKAICDYADGNKANDKKNRQQLAAKNAAQFVVHVLQLGGFARTPQTPNPIQSNANPIPTQAPPSVVPTTNLRDMLVKAFSLNELRTLCSDLGIDHEDIPATEKISFARELIQYTKRRERLNQLITRCSELRPDFDWQTGS